MPTPLEAFKVHMNIPAEDTADDLALQQKLEVATAWVGNIVGGPVTDTDPAPIHEACRMLAAHLFESREATLIGITAQELPFGVLDLLDPYRAWY
ncbi:head-tail connector protein [Methylobacterium oxalidis]|uniref:head-tail connector protein n=1 Tax=Methylobacterium oxalidis TaxID=944322 RepID=UPI003316485A